MIKLLLNSLQVRNLLESVHGPKPSPHTPKRSKPSPEESGEWNISSISKISKSRFLYQIQISSIGLLSGMSFVRPSLFATPKAAASQTLDGELMEKLCGLLTQSQVPWKELAEKLGMLTLAHLYQESPSPCQNLLENYQVMYREWWRKLLSDTWVCSLLVFEHEATQVVFMLFSCL